MIFEAKTSNNNVLFLTLTYDDIHLPKADQFQGGELSKEDVQLFIKRLRKNYYYASKYIPKTHKIRYYAVGEYGSNTYRAHYHILLFGLDFNDKYIESSIRKSWQKCTPERLQIDTIGLKELSKNLITTFYGKQLSPDSSATAGLVASFNYVMKYVLKKDGDKSNQDRQKEFSLKSQSIGRQYIQDVIAPKLRKKELYPIRALDSHEKALFKYLYIDKRHDKHKELYKAHRAYNIVANSDDTIQIANKPSALQQYMENIRYQKEIQKETPIKIFVGNYLAYHDGTIELELTDDKIKSTERHKNGFIATMDDRSMQSLLKSAYPDLQPALHYFYNSMTLIEQIQFDKYEKHLDMEQQRLIELGYIKYGTQIFTDVKSDTWKYDKTQKEIDNLKEQKKQRLKDNQITKELT